MLNALVSIIRTGRYNLLTKQVNKVCFRGIIVNIRNRRRFKHNKLTRIIGYTDIQALKILLRTIISKSRDSIIV